MSIREKRESWFAQSLVRRDNNRERYKKHKGDKGDFEKAISAKSLLERIAKRKLN